MCDKRIRIRHYGRGDGDLRITGMYGHGKLGTTVLHRLPDAPGLPCLEVRNLHRLSSDDFAFAGHFKVQVAP